MPFGLDIAELHNYARVLRTR